MPQKKRLSVIFLLGYISVLAQAPTESYPLDSASVEHSKIGNDQAIVGSSNGEVCAFTAAWERPEAFSRVFSAIGSYVSLRGPTATRL
ncbi:hypothetical protein [Spirosoma spitsbergense]|uniref:hypothetical protein n=1 Tax=Spirosoma spitsbergense TaxID=431554 RepID=UPI000368235B|nr:hypothetical protein [Spirosoma spitsbergense]